MILELYIQQDEYLPILSDTAGIRLIIHNQTYMPLPEKEGIVLSPGVSSNIAITKVSMHDSKMTDYMLTCTFREYVFVVKCTLIWTKNNVYIDNQATVRLR